MKIITNSLIWLILIIIILGYQFTIAMAYQFTHKKKNPIVLVQDHACIQAGSFVFGTITS